MNETKRAKVHVSLRIEESVLQEAKDYAERHRRSLSNLIVYALQVYLRRYNSAFPETRNNGPQSDADPLADDSAAFPGTSLSVEGRSSDGKERDTLGVRGQDRGR